MPAQTKNRKQNMQSGGSRLTLSVASLSVVCCAVVLCAANTHEWLARAARQKTSTQETITPSSQASAAPSPSLQEEAQTQARDQTAASQNHPSRTGGGNLSMQPEALKLGRALGKRFNERVDVESQSSGTLTVDQEQRQVHITRGKNDAGESLNVTLTGGGRNRATFTWEAGEGVQASDNRRVEEAERLLVERLVYDSPDYFVLAQLRGASYYAVARQVRPAAAGGDDNYAGPTWDIVSVREPAHSGEGGFRQRRVRLYYLNTKTSLIDKVVTREEDETQTVAEITAWEERGGERAPAHIIWRRGAEVLLEYRQTSFAHTPGRRTGRNDLP